MHYHRPSKGVNGSLWAAHFPERCARFEGWFEGDAVLLQAARPPK